MKSEQQWRRRWSNSDGGATAATGGGPATACRLEAASTTARAGGVVKRSSDGVDGDIVGRDGGIEGGKQRRIVVGNVECCKEEMERNGKVKNEH